jgi:hypothetical protein
MAIKRYTNSKGRNFAYSLYYAFLNLGGAAAGFAIDLVKGAAGASWHRMPSHLMPSHGIVTSSHRDLVTIHW